MAFPRRLALSLAVLPVGLLAPGSARAEGGVTLAWSAPAGCPSRDDVLAETRRLLGGRIAADTAVAARADVALAGTSDYRLRIAIGPGSTERPREVHAPTCAELGDAAALILALAIDPVAVASAPPGGSLRADKDAPPPPPAPEPLPDLLPAPLFFPAGGTAPIQTGTLPPAGSALPVLRGSSTWGAVPGANGQTGPPSGGPGAGAPAPGTSGPGATPLNTGSASAALAPLIPVPRFFAPVFSTPSPRRPRPPAPPPPALRAHAVFSTEVGTFRDVAPMLRAGFSLVPGPLRVEAAAVLAWGGEVAVAGEPGKGGELWMGAGAVSGCYEGRVDRGDPRPASIAACAGIEIGAITATSYGVTDPATARSPWVTPTIGGLFRWGLAPGVALRVDLLLGVPLVLPRFRIGGIGVVHEPADVVARTGAGVEIDLSRP